MNSAKGQEAEPSRVGPLKRAAVIVNSKSRRGRQWFPQVIEELEEHGFEVVSPVLLRNPKKLISTVQKFLDEEMPLIAIGGGDGTFSTVAGLFIGSKSVLGVLPLGTGNSFARDLGIAANVQAACDVLVHGKPFEVDLGKANDEYFVNVATVGLSTRIAENLTNEAKKRFGRLVYAFALMTALRKIRPFQARIITDDSDDTFTTLQVVVGNGRFHAGPFPLTPEARINEGKLSCYALTNASKWALFRYALRLRGGRHVDLHEVHAFNVANMTLHTTPNKRLTIDGEICSQTPIEFSVLHKAIRVMVPQAFEG